MSWSLRSYMKKSLLVVAPYAPSLNKNAKFKNAWMPFSTDRLLWRSQAWSDAFGGKRKTHKAQKNSAAFQETALPYQLQLSDWWTGSCRHHEKSPTNFRPNHFNQSYVLNALTPEAGCKDHSKP